MITEPPTETAGDLIRILLSKAASDVLTATGEQAFAIAHRSMRGTEDPDSAGRWVITLAPVTWETAHDAAAVLVGEKRAMPLKRSR